MRKGLCVSAIAVAVLIAGAAAAQEGKRTVTLTPGPEWKILSTFSGKVDYYKVVEEGGEKIIRASYDPKLDTVIMFRKLRKPRSYATMKWKWRVHKFPVGANETIEGKMDSAGAVYVYFKETLREYAIKYVWSAGLEKGTSFQTKDSNILKKMRLVVLEGTPPETGKWRAEEVDLQADFRKYFLDGKADGEVPEVVGVGLLTDGDGTQTFVEADYAGFELRE